MTMNSSDITQIGNNNILISNNEGGTVNIALHPANKKEHLSLDEQFKELITATYNCTAKYRKLMNSNHRTEDNEMAVLEAIHSSVQDLFFFYEQYKGCSQAEVALSIVNLYNDFFSSFKRFLDNRNMAKDFNAEALEAEHRFDMLVDALLQSKALIVSHSLYH